VLERDGFGAHDEVKAAVFRAAPGADLVTPKKRLGLC